MALTLSGPSAHDNEVDRLTTAETDSTRARFHAVVTELRTDGVVLDATIFCPSTNERVSDQGLLGDAAVVDVVRTDGGSIVHILHPVEAIRLLRIGDQVDAEIDLDRRWVLSRLHTALHLASFGYEAIHGPAVRAERRVSVEGGMLRLVPNQVEPVQRDAIIAWIERAIDDDLLISTIDRRQAGGRRRWLVDGIGNLACEGLHPTSTGQVGKLALDIRADLIGSVTIGIRLLS